MLEGWNRQCLGVSALVCWTLSVACGDDPDPQVIEDVTFASSLNIDLASMQVLENGAYIGDRVVGSGAEVVDGFAVNVSYTGWLIDGAVFDPGFGPLAFTVGGGTVLPAFEGATVGMKVGGTRLVIIPPGQAYGHNPPPSSTIPPGAILIFEITVDSLG